jgi:hypothetical protein
VFKFGRSRFVRSHSLNWVMTASVSNLRELPRTPLYLLGVIRRTQDKLDGRSRVQRGLEAENWAYWQRFALLNPLARRSVNDKALKLSNGVPIVEICRLRQATCPSYRHSQRMCSLLWLVSAIGLKKTLAKRSAAKMAGGSR